MHEYVLLWRRDRKRKSRSLIEKSRSLFPKSERDFSVNMLLVKLYKHAVSVNRHPPLPVQVVQGVFWFVFGLAPICTGGSPHICPARHGSAFPPNSVGGRAGASCILSTTSLMKACCSRMRASRSLMPLAYARTCCGRCYREE